MADWFLYIVFAFLLAFGFWGGHLTGTTRTRAYIAAKVCVEQGHTIGRWDVDLDAVICVDEARLDVGRR